MHSIHKLLAATIAVGALAIPASAYGSGLKSLPAPIPVPAGQVQHTVTDIKFTGKKPWHHVVESWVSATRARAITREANGGVISDCTLNDGRARCRSAAYGDEEWTPLEPDLTSWQYRGALIKQQIDAGWYAVAGTTRFAGRPAQVLKGTDREPRDGPGSTSLVVDAETLAPLREEFAIDQGGRRSVQTHRVTTFEILDSADFNFARDARSGRTTRRP